MSYGSTKLNYDQKAKGHQKKPILIHSIQVYVAFMIGTAIYTHTLLSFSRLSRTMSCQ